MTNEISLQDVANYLDNIGIQFLATIGLDGKPKVRPMQYMILDDGKLWFCTNSEKDVYQVPSLAQTCTAFEHQCISVRQREDTP